ncbi:MAG: hypothetical protein JWN86_2390 [Planctomycetota bacterium]|nr:hypothetical protein [Planctomycetota bacterium]
MTRRSRGVFRSLRIRLRYQLRKLDRETPEWLRWLTPWGTSLVLHAAALAVLGLLVYVSSEDGHARPALESQLAANQLTEDLTSLKPADKAGDPFITLQTPDPPSFSLDPKGADNIAAPESLLPIGPGNGLMTTAAPPEVAASGAGTGPSLRVPEPSVPFSGRQGEAKARLVRREGGSVESERAVEMGIDWLSRHQRKDGSWSLNHRGQCQGAGCPSEGTGESDVAATGLALLPMLGAGHSHLGPGRYQATLKRGIDWLLSIQKSDGELFIGGGGNTRMYSHGIATMALCEAYGVTRDSHLKEPAERALGFIVKSQSPDDGGWRYNPGEQGDTSVFGWQIMAIRSGQLAGLKVPPDVFKGATRYLDKAASDPRKTTYGYQPGQPNSPVMSAEALLVRQYLGWPRDSKELSNGVKLVSTHLLRDQERNIYYWYYSTQLLHNMQNVAWKAWNPTIRNGLVSIQVTGNGCARGSWDPNKPTPDRWGREIGRHYTTAMSLLTLEVYYRYLPLYKARDQALPDMTVGAEASPSGK